MKSILLLLPWIFAGHSLQAQYYQIQYHHTVTFDAITTYSEYDLYLSRETGIYYETKRKMELHTGDQVRPVNTQVIPFVKKDYNAKTMHYNQPVTSKIFIVEDKLPAQTWTLSDESRKITQFTCNKATTTFRGRTYTAWYTTELPVIGGPWKFDGLPGLILEVSSDDGVLSIKAVRIEKKDSLDFPKPSYGKSERVSWEQYCSEYRKTMERIKKSLQADADPDIEYTLDHSTVEDVGL